MKRLLVKVERVEPGKIGRQRIAYAVSDDNRSMVFDVIGDLIKVTPRDVLEVIVSEVKPDNIDEYEFCGHGYLVTPESKFDETILSLWGIIFKFKPPIGLELDRKYYLCLKHL
ncbi:MAG: DNA-directed RNA polymerase subunit G [Desulfurococcales archaeon]|nr:DNA-directed RNA polymerase subunit G [Desulfurococcales archaeon]